MTNMNMYPTIEGEEEYKGTEILLGYKVPVGI